MLTSWRTRFIVTACSLSLLIGAAVSAGEGEKSSTDTTQSVPADKPAQGKMMGCKEDGSCCGAAACQQQPEQAEGECPCQRAKKLREQSKS